MSAIAARTETAEQRAAIYGTLRRRNRLVAILRIGLPAIGAVLFAALLVQFFVGSLTPDFGFANVRIDRDNIVVETPSYSGVGAGGAVYSVTAGSARAAIGNTDLVYLTDATFELRQPEGTTFAAAAATAAVEVPTQVVTVDGVTEVESSNGLRGTIVGARVDMLGETLVSNGAADLHFANGTRIEAETMTYDNGAQVWGFKRATVTLPGLPGTSTADAAATGGVSP